MRRIIILAVACLALAGCGKGGMEAGTGTTVPARKLTGTFTLTDYSGIGKTGKTATDGCWGTGGYSDIEGGTQVVVTDGDGKTLATGSLGTGTYKPDVQYPTIGDCVFPIQVDTELPKADFYKVAVGRRGDLTYSLDDMESNGWSVAFSLG